MASVTLSNIILEFSSSGLWPLNVHVPCDEGLRAGRKADSLFSVAGVVRVFCRG